MKMDYAAYIEAIMETYAKTQLDLASVVGTSQQTISNWLKGYRRITPERLLVLKKIFPKVKQDSFPEGKGLRSRRIFKGLKADVRGFAHCLKALEPQERKKLLRRLTNMVKFYEQENGTK
jgi:transcriptional regulator with XRE-family HTH domain